MTSRPPRVTVLSGPSGAGKTTVAALLATGAARPTVNLTTDTFYTAVATGFVPPYLEEAGPQNVVVLDAVLAAVTAWARGGYDVVVDGVVGTTFLAPFRSAAARERWDLRYVVLRPALAVTLARGTARAEPELRDAAALRTIHGYFDDLGGLAGHAVDTSRDDPAATADALRGALENGGFAIAAATPPDQAPERTDPPLRGDELATLRGFLDFHRDTLRRKTSGLDAAGLGANLPPSTMTLGGLLKHLAYVESHWFTVVLAGADPVPPFGDVDWAADADWEWHSAADDSPESLRELYDRAVAASDARLDAALTQGGLDLLTARADRREGGRYSLRFVLVHMVEEYCRHNGHADLLREAVDGTTGE